jgi:hypothetical protein
LYHHFREKLRPLPEGSPIAEELVSSIVEKANGVFFWVFLVVRSVREGLHEGDSVAIMRERVDELPSDLEAYFTLMLKRIPKVYRKRTYRALKIAELTIGQDAPYGIYDPFSFIKFWILSQELLDNERFAFDLDFQYIDEHEKKTMYAKTRRFLGACCKDFLHLKPQRITVEHNPTEFSEVEFLHRTVHDFLMSEQMRHIIDENVPAHFKNILFPLQMALARLKMATDRSLTLWLRTIEAMANDARKLDDSHQTMELVTEYERAAIRYFDHTSMPEYDLQSVPDNALERTVMRRIAGFFASYQLRSFIEMIVTTDPSVVRANIPHTCSILGATLGLSSDHPFLISKISRASLQFLLQNGVVSNPAEVRTWHAFLAKAMTEHVSWSANDQNYAAEIVLQLLYFGADMQSKVALPLQTQLPGSDGSYPYRSPIDILRVCFPESQVNAILDSMEPSADGWVVLNGECSNGRGTSKINSAGTVKPRHAPTVEVLRLGLVVGVALFKAGLAGLGWE